MDVARRLRQSILSGAQQYVLNRRPQAYSVTNGNIEGVPNLHGGRWTHKQAARPCVYALALA